MDKEKALGLLRISRQFLDDAIAKIEEAEKVEDHYLLLDYTIHNVDLRLEIIRRVLSKVV